MLPTGFPSACKTAYPARVGNKAANTSVVPARNLAHTMRWGSKGWVSKSSSVPFLRSSAMERMVMAGIRKRNTQGVNRKKAVNSATPVSSKFHCPGNTQWNKPLTSRNTAKTTAPITDDRNARSSFL